MLSDYLKYHTLYRVLIICNYSTFGGHSLLPELTQSHVSIERLPVTSAELGHPEAHCGFSELVLCPSATLSDGPTRVNTVRPCGLCHWEGNTLATDENRTCEKTNTKHCVNANKKISNSS